MSYELGRAELIIDIGAEQYFADLAQVFNETTKDADEITKTLAKQLKIRERDVKAAAAITIAENKKAAQETLKAERDAAAQRKAQTQELLKFHQREYKEEVAAKKQAEKEKLEAERKAAADRKALAVETMKFYQREYAAEVKAKKDAEAAKIKAQRDAEREQRRSGNTVFGYNPQGIKGDIATLLGFGAIASGALVLREAIVSVVEATTKQEQAQRSLNAAFGQSSGLFKQQADAYAAQFGRVSSSVEQATTRFGVLNSQTNLTTEQIKNLIPVALDLQAAFGGDLEEVFRSIAGAILGETEAFEKYGLVLQEQVLKSSDKLTESERRRFSTMSESEKQMIRFRLIMEKASEVQGTAAQRANETQGGFDKLGRAADELAKTLGSALIPELGKAAGAFGELILSLDGFIKKYLEYYNARERVLQQDAQIASERDAQDIKARVQADLRNRNNGPLGAGNGLFGPIIEGLEPTSDTNQRIQAEIDRKKDLDAYIKGVKERIQAQRSLEDAEKKAATDKRARQEAEDKADRDRLLRTLEFAKDREIERIQEAKRLAEIEKKNKLDAISEAQQAELRRIDDVEDARRAASEQELNRIQAERDAALDAVDVRRDAELERIETEKEAAEAAAEAEIRRLTIERDRLANEADKRKDDELERLEDEKEARDRLRKQEDYEIEDSIKRRERLLEDAHTKELRRLERQGEALRDAYDDEIAKIDDKEDKEEERHRKALTRTNKERNAAIDAIDAQIDAIEAAERRRDEARRRRELNNRLSDAQVRLRQATGSGDAVAAGQARDKLVSAIRIGDPTAIKKAQDELAEIVGQGVEAVAAAQRDLGDLQADIRDNDVKTTEQAEKEKLEAQKKALQQQEDNEKEQEDNRNRRRKDSLEKDKRAAKEKLDDALRKIERLEEAENEKFKKDKRELDDSVEASKRALEQTRDEEDQAHENSIEAVQRRHKTERDEIEETYNGEDHGYIPNIKRALEATKNNYKTQTEEAQRRYKAERKDIEDTYNNPLTGLIAQHQAMERDARKTYENLVRTVRDNYEAARKEVEKAYRADDGKSGILDKLDEQERYTNEKLALIKIAFENAAKGLVGDDGVITTQWKDAIEESDKYFDHIRRRATEPLPQRESNRGTGSGESTYGPGGDTGGGMGTVPSTPGTSAPSGTPDPEQTSTAIPEDDVSGLYSVAFGYGAKYSGNFQAAPGWEGGAAWPGGPSHHKGVDLIVPGARSNGYGTPIPAFYGGRVLRTVPDSRGPGGNMVVIDDGSGRTHWYLHLKDYTVHAGQTVKRGDIIAHMGDTGTEDFPHLHYEVRMGDNNGPMSLEALRRDGIDPMTFVRGRRDSGYKFMNPTMYQDMRTGERGVLAERGPERLLGRRDTQTFDSMGLTAKLRRPNPFVPDYDQMGSSAIGAQTVAQVVNNRGGDSLTYYGVAPEDMMRRWRADQRRRNGLRGIR